MSQNSFVVANGSGAAVRAALNNALNSAVTLNSGASSPSTTYADMWWMDTTLNLLKMRNSTNASWVTVGLRDATNLGLASLAGDNVFTGRVQMAQGTNVASAASITLPSNGNYVFITGIVTITSVGSLQAGTVCILEFVSAGCQVTHSSVLYLQDTFMSSAGAVLCLVSQGGGIWKEVWRAPVAHKLPSPIINGGIEVGQRTGGTAGTVAFGLYGPDKWKTVGTHAATGTLGQSTTVPTVIDAGYKIANTLQATTTVGDASVAVSDSFSIRHIVEGYLWAPFSQRDCVLSFWVRSPKTGTHSVSFHNKGGDRAFIGTYTINTINTFEYKVIQVPASPSAGTWNYAAEEGLIINWVLMCGSNFFGTAGSWFTSAAFVAATSAQPNCIDAASSFYLTAVKLELGHYASVGPARTFVEDLHECKRYFQKSFEYTTVPAQNVGNLTGEAQFPALVAGGGTIKSPRISLYPPMRTVSSLLLYSPSALSSEIRNETRSQTCTSTSAVDIKPNGFFFQGLGSVGTIVADTLGIHWTADGDM